MVKPSALEGYSVPEVWATVARSEADASVCLWKDETTKAKDCPMTPTAQIAAIRQRTEDAWTNGCTIDEATAAVFDRATLMDIWDTHQSALRALVAELREQAERPSRWAMRGQIREWSGCPYCLKPLRLVPSEER